MPASQRSRGDQDGPEHDVVRKPLRAIRPRDPGAPASQPRPYSPRIREVVAHIEANYRTAIPLGDLAAIAKIGVVRLVTSFRREVGVPPHRYQLDLRVRAAQDLLAQGMRPAAAAIEAGFFDQSHLTRHFKRVCGSTPGRYRGMAGLARDAAPEGRRP